MTSPVEELLAVYVGLDVPPDRQQKLLALLEQDPELRRRFAAELHLRGLLQLARTADPRWPLLEEEWGRTAPPSPTLDDERLLSRLMAERQWAILRRRALVTAVLVVTTVGLYRLVDRLRARP